MKTSRFALLAGLILLSACVDREKADAKLVRGCQAAIAVILPEGHGIKEIKNSAFNPSAEFGANYREVVLTAIESDGWVESDQEYQCVFAEEFGFLGSKHYAVLHQVTAHDQTYGNKDGQILGAPETIIDMTARVENAMRE
jgi:hypothetical protein